MTHSEFLTTSIITVSLALIGYLVKYFNDVSITKRKDKLDRVNHQLKDLYGPLLSLTNSSNTAWVKFRSIYRNYNPAYFDSRNPPNEEEMKVWRLWMTTVFFPIVDKKYNIIIDNTDLIIEDHFPKCLEDFCAHVNTYRPVLEKWKNGDYSEHVSLLGYPKELNSYFQSVFDKLKKEQNRLLR
jgi:hypothetical protein